MTFAPQVVNSSDKEGGKVPRSAKIIVFENSDLTSSFITTMIHQPNKHKDGIVNHIT